MLELLRESLLGEWHGPIASACRLVGRRTRAGLRDTRAGRLPFAGSC